MYLGADTNLHRPVAIKVFDVGARTKSAQVDRFIQEARMMAGWRHENIVQIYYAGNESNIFYYVMEYIDGYDLASIMSVYAEKDELMPINDVLRIGDSIAAALDYAHEQGVIHRDVKPANVMVANSDGRVVLGDFGLALNLNDKSQGEVFGSPHYIAPEQARRSSDAVPQSDLYSLGVILYEMITGATPFNDLSAASLALQHITDEPPSPRSINPSISIKVEEVLLKALQKSPQDRYQSGKKLMGALRKAIEINPLKAQPETPALPPIPVNAPAIRRSDISLNSFTHRKDVATALKEKTSSIHPEVDDPPISKGKWGFGWIAIPILLLLAFGGIAVFRPDMLRSAGQLFMSATTSTETKSSADPEVQSSKTNTAIPENTATFIPATKTQSATITSVPTITTTATQSIRPTSTATSIPTVVTSTTTSTPTGYHMTAFYNGNSIYIFNMGTASRSVSGFIFERIDADGVIQERFEGWEWEKYFNVIQPNRCLSLEIHEAEGPYLRPSECENKILSPLVLTKNSGKVFWVSDEPNGQFRILWLNQEIARCKMEDGTCDFYVP